MIKKVFYILKNIAYAVLIVFMALYIFINVKGIGQKDFIPGIGVYKILVVLSGSMEPTFYAGDAIIGKSVSVDNLKNGDIITFKYNDSLTTHRIININKDEGKAIFYTKGDRNNVEDIEPVEGKNIVAKFLFRIPLLGYLITAMRGKIGIAVIWILIILSLFMGIRKKNKKKDVYYSITSITFK